VSTRANQRGFVAVFRDLASTCLGIVVILHQEFHGPVNPWLIGFAGLALGVPGIAGAIALAWGIQHPDTPLPPSDSQRRDSRSSLPS
jgi:hypothetical protein